MPTYYEILAVSKSASTDEIKKAYKKLAVKYHPDKNPGNEEQATEMFKKVAEAYDTLSDPIKRRDYDTAGSYQSSSSSDFRRDFSRNRAFDIFEAFFNDMRDFHDPFDDHFFHHRFGGFSDDNRRGDRRSNRDRVPPSFDSFFGGGGPMMLGGFRGIRDLLDGDSSFSGFSSSSSTVYNGYGGGAKSVSTKTFIGPDGKRTTKTETTVYHPDGSVETKVDEFEDEAPRRESNRLQNGGRSAPRLEVTGYGRRY